MRLARCVAAVTAVLALSAGNLAACAGWQATPEARMACCLNGTQCPMHQSGSHGSDSKRSITQLQADSCCAATSERAQSSVAGSSLVLPIVTALPLAPDAVVPVPVLALQEWRALVPLPVSPVPRHLLLTVLLV